MDPREVLEQRRTTLRGLLDTPGGPLGDAGGDIAAKLQSGWQAERRLINRVLDEAGQGGVEATIERWQARTEAFIESSEDEQPSWTGRQGETWDANQVLTLLEELSERIGTWSGVDRPDLDGGAGDDAGPGGGEGADGRQPAIKDGG